YNGEEIGMTDYLISDINQIRDPLSNHIYNLEIKSGTNSQEAALIAARHGRDICRTPMQWKNAPNGGFCPESVTPWLPVNPNYAKGINVEQQLANPSSLLQAYRLLLGVRKQNPALQAGEYQPVLTGSRSVLAFTRTAPGQTCLVAINYTPKNRTVRVPELNRVSRVILASKTGGHPSTGGKLVLQPYEVWVGELSGA
nr:alpha-glucosidase C-terminal domain-containing protein [Anaerolineaceae bacterium]